MGDSEHLPERSPHQHTQVTVGTPQAASNIDAKGSQANQSHETSSDQHGPTESTESTLTNTHTECTDEHEVNLPTSSETP